MGNKSSYIKTTFFLFCKNMHSRFLNVTLLIASIFFIALLQNTHLQGNAFFFTTLIMVLPSVIFIQEMQHTIDEDAKMGIIEQWIGNGKSLFLYLILKSVSFSFFLVLPFLIISTMFLAQQFEQISNVGYAILCLLIICESFILLSSLLGLARISTSITSVLLLTIQIPSMLVTLNAIQAENYFFAVLICCGSFLLALSLAVLFPSSVQRSIF
jgi:hypothetical protein